MKNPNPNLRALLGLALTSFPVLVALFLSACVFGLETVALNLIVFFFWTAMAGSLIGGAWLVLTDGKKWPEGA